ncbi:hypothetical protein V865_003153 [Kwoniella europaea PYCC6329]|uniref:BZIP domain-containing protein n=1 Tax=Kwoniella europaea PYCC6329 TaxID=1423913 RepID=A0AAX4KER8_9TREE
MPQTTTSSPTPTTDLKMRMRKIKASELPVRKRRRVSSEPGEETVAFVGLGDPLQMSDDDGHRAASGSKNRSLLGKLNGVGSGSKCESLWMYQKMNRIAILRLELSIRDWGRSWCIIALREENETLKEELESKKKELESKKKELDKEKEKVEELSEKLNEETKISSAREEEYT